MAYINFIMPVIAAVGLIVIIVVLLIVKSIVQKEQIKSNNTQKMDSLAEELLKENAEMKKDLKVIKEKVEAIDKMMREI